MKEAIFNLLKFVIFVLVIPGIIGISVAFYTYLNQTESLGRDNFLIGVVAFTLFYFFICPPLAMFQFGQHIVGGMFRFNAVLSRALQLLIPFYSLISLICVYLGRNFFGWGQQLLSAMVIMTGFTFAMHIVMTARELYEADASVVKPHYFFAMSLTYILSLSVFAGLWCFVFPTFNLTEFFQATYHKADQIYAPIVTQLFFP